MRSHGETQNSIPLRVDPDVWEAVEKWGRRRPAQREREVGTFILRRALKEAGRLRRRKAQEENQEAKRRRK